METVTTDEQMVERALSGDPEAFGEIVRRWERRIFALSFGMLGREDDARDATQETFLAAFRNLRGFRGEAKVSSWLHRIAVNQCITRQRRAKVRSETALEDEAEKNAAVLLCRQMFRRRARRSTRRSASQFARLSARCRRTCDKLW